MASSTDGMTLMEAPPRDGMSGAAAPAMASRMGADLRAARERVGCSLPAMSAHLRIRLPYLEAIEDGRIADLPGTAYAMGFVRTYAQSLGLDADEISRRFRAETATMNRKTELSFPAPVPERGVPAGVVMLLGVLVAVGAYAGWYRLSGERSAPDPVRPVPARLAEMAQPAAMPPPLAVPSAAKVPPASKVLAALPPVAAPPPVTSTGPASTGSASTGVSPSSAAAAVPARPAAAAATAVASAAPAAPPAIAAPATPVPAAPVSATPVSAAPAADGGRIVLQASADSWVQVRDPQGSVLLNRILRPGETWPVPNRAGLTLTTGNAGGTELVVDGVATSPLGGNGAVRRDLPLDPAAILAGKLSPATH